MNKSIEFIKQRINEGVCADWVPKTGWDKANVFNPYDILEFDEAARNEQNFMLSCDGYNTKVQIIYDPNADFDYVSFDQCWHDGTLLFDYETMYNVAKKPFGLFTYNKNIVPEDFDCDSLASVFKFEYEFIIGDIVELTEYSESPFKDKPWANVHTVVGMPIKMKFIQKEN